MTSNGDECTSNIPKRIRIKKYKDTVPEWYKIPEVPFEKYVGCLEGLYRVFEKPSTSKAGKDDFQKTIILARTGMTEDEWKESERIRSYTKVLEMNMGYFHEKLIGKFSKYETLQCGHATGCDVRKLDNTELWEIKNRQNTMNSNSTKTVISTLHNVLDSGKKAILVLINVWDRTVPRFGARKEVIIWSGQEAYTYLSGRTTFYADLQETLHYTFKNFKTFENLRSEII